MRLVAAGLRAGGYRVVAKITGTQPKLILPDGERQSDCDAGARRRSASSRASSRQPIARGADAVVVEAMAIEPEYLDALERFYIRATDLLITNVRPDHQEQLGPAPGRHGAMPMSRAFPPGGRLFVTAEAASRVVLARGRRAGLRAVGQ